MSKNILNLNKVKLSEIGPDNILWLKINEMEDNFGSNHIIGLEVYEGIPRLIVYSDKNKEDPSHIINLEKALK